ncbi:hook-length control protein FliK [Gracilibacillus ureilyticus]|uniref:Hook-length control protein FliK n=1 Tax=Gracilibacillus ureilyticus TaxID=531814 RepID=A0A1H9L4K4_9BACI|nr:flagellar hook-length control protein FliK [Gracilibacillus ureilyticus]SER06431.1 hook-length control protein FliK [Gracilibacillus ureilyticus]
MFVGANFMANITTAQSLPNTKNQTGTGNSFQQLLSGVTGDQSDGNIRTMINSQEESNSATELLSILSEAPEEVLHLLRELLAGEEVSEESMEQVLSNSDLKDQKSTNFGLVSLIQKIIAGEEIPAESMLHALNDVEPDSQKHTYIEMLSLIKELLNKADSKEGIKFIEEFMEIVAEDSVQQSGEDTSTVPVQVDILQKLQDLLGNNSENESSGLNIASFLTTSLNVQQVSMENVAIDIEKIAKLWRNVETLINKMENQLITTKDYKQLMNMLQQWSQLSQQDSAALNNFLSAVDQSKAKSVWGKMVENYQNRMKTDKLYGQTQQVTKDDIAKWLKSALENYETTMKADSNLVRADVASWSGQQSTSKVQQFVIHVQQTNTGEQVAQKQLLEQFQQAIQKSSFLKSPNGTNQLILRLQPGNLGDVMVKLTQVNGEMVVKMVVQSQAAKELLEGNLNQLRHMFSPQQVVIEKQEPIAMQNSQDKLWQDDSEQTSEQGQSGSDQYKEHESESEQDNNSTFHDLLMDMKV